MRYKYSENKSKKNTDCTRTKLYDWQPSVGMRLENMFKFKDRQPKHLQNGVVYKITCSCGKMYIGETGRCLKTRISEHMKTSGTNITEVGQHLADNPTCSMSFEDVQVLAYENKIRKRRILESLYILPKTKKFGCVG